VSFLFGGVRGHEDPDLAAANRRSRLRLARDINDEATLARDGEVPIRRGGRQWWWLALFAVALVVVGFVSGHRGGAEIALAPDCAHPAAVVAPSPVAPGQPLSYRIAGPAQGGYVVSLDGAPVQGKAVSGASVGYLDTAAGPALLVPRCVSPTMTVPAPTATGSHTLLVQRVLDGRATPVATVGFTVSS
jgi:hypothetical protein